ncbi:MAG: flagellar hook-associated protein FlgK [Candidatus Eremiobacteraeota bacterium]|nr:flagellar hook-associated protein FlgK [Candidatus Eremiobacteraeota bacterium]
MSFFGLNIAGSALDAYQQAENTTSNNIANVNTPGASRQEVNFNEAPPVVGSPAYATWYGPGTQGEGVVVQSITRIHQDSYDGLFRGASSAQNYFTTQQNQLTSLQAAFSEPSNGINTAFSALQTAFTQLASTPSGDQSGGTAARANVISAAQTFVAHLNAVGSAVQTAKSTAIAQATTIVNQANNLIDQIAALNGQIRASTAIGDNPNTYKDQRDQLVDQLSQLLSTQTSVQSNGSTLVTVGGRALVNDTKAYHLAAPVVGTDPSGNPTLEIGMVGDPNPSNPVPVALGSGQLAAYVDLYNKNLTSYGQQLDNFASATANELDRIMQSGYDQNGNAGAALLQPIVGSSAITATNIQVGITDAAQLPVGLASTAAGTLTTAMNSANNTVDTSVAITPANVTFAYPPAAANSPAGSKLTVIVNGVTQTFAYNWGAGGNASSIDTFMSNFNAAQLGVTASFDSTAQKIVFTRDPSNEGLALRAAQVGASSPSFTITDSNAPLAAGTPQGTTTNSLLSILGAGAISGVAQNSTNAFGAGDNSGANAAIKVFTKNVGVPALQYTATTAIAAPGTVTVTPAPGTFPFAQVGVGTVLTLDGGAANQENVVVTAVDKTTGSITFTASLAHAANYSIATAQTQTLGAYYGGLVSQLGLDTANAKTGASSQTTLASNIDQVRQGIDGINIDEETQNLVKFQNAYAAAARTMNVLEQMLQTAIGLIPST